MDTAGSGGRGQSRQQLVLAIQARYNRRFARPAVRSVDCVVPQFAAMLILRWAVPDVPDIPVLPDLGTGAAVGC